MSIKDEILKLQRLEAKIKYYELLSNMVSTELKPKDEFPDLLPEFVAEVRGFIDARITEIDETSKVTPNATHNTATAGATSKEEASYSVKPKNLPEPEKMDPITFALRWRHLSGKAVTFSTPNGNITGVVKGCLTPNLVVVTENGYQIKIDPKDIIKES